jgi:hypothetical protein
MSLAPRAVIIVGREAHAPKRGPVFCEMDFVDYPTRGPARL